MQSEGRPDRDEETVVAVHMKNGMVVLGVLQSIDQNMNMEITKLDQGSLPKTL